ncbi:hypothetical protein BHM03_00038251 [Ensete ventricosum]|nr:hypothetical protein BHM03_00038251 [Ensete ventricosum]
MKRRHCKGVWRDSVVVSRFDAAMVILRCGKEGLRLWQTEEKEAIGGYDRRCRGCSIFVAPRKETLATLEDHEWSRLQRLLLTSVEKRKRW